jgi:hypothetical protein
LSGLTLTRDFNTGIPRFGSTFTSTFPLDSSDTTPSSFVSFFLLAGVGISEHLYLQHNITSTGNMLSQ